MAAELKRMTLVVTPEMEGSLNSVKKEMFYNQSRSYMIRELLTAGLRGSKEKKEKENGDYIV